MNRLLRLSTFKVSKFNWQKGTKLDSGFTVLSTTQQPDFKCHLHHLLHDHSQAQLFHLENSDSNNCFASIIQTLTDNHKGTPHILEHLACCGSELFPIRDPFFNMLKRSLNTYMNAWTGDDFTCYPFSTANKKDFQNLLRVYADMVFKPTLHYLDFRQEGWRHEVNEAGELEYKGIVLNEMKGAYQSPDRQLYFEVVNNLFSDTVYSYDTGGHPNHIVNLSYEELKETHRRFYHPSNIKFFSYGDHNLPDTLHYLNNTYLAKSKPLASKAPFNIIPKVLKSRSTITNKANENDMVLSFYIGNLTQMPQDDLYALSILNYLLFESNQALLYETLIESGIAETFGDINGFNPSHMVGFSVGVKGIDPSLTHEKFEEIVYSALNKLKETGVSKDRIEQAFHNYEVNLAIARKNNGLKMLEMLLTPINVGCNISEQLSYKEPLRRLKEKLLNDNKYLNTVIDKYFLNNQHHVTVKSVHKEDQPNITKVPSTFEVTEMKPSSEGLDMEKIKKEQQELKQRQEQKVDNNILPILELSDIQKTPQQYYLTRHTLKSNSQVNHVSIDSPVNHYRCIYRFKDLSPELNLALDLFTYTINKGVSTSKYNYKELSKELGLCSTKFRVTFDHIDLTGETIVIFSLACLESNAPRAVTLLKEIIEEMKFDPVNIKNIFKSYKNDVTVDVVNNPMEYARSAAFSLINPMEQKKNKLELARFNHRLASEYLEDESKGLVLFEKISNLLTKSGTVPEFLVYSDKLFETDSQVASILSSISPSKSNLNVDGNSFKDFQSNYVSTTYTHPNYDVNCCVQAYAGPQLFTPDSARIQLFLQLLEHKHLHKEIREKGGAYGSGAKQQSSSCIALSSYLDPHCQETFDIFENSVKDLLANGHLSISAQELKEAKLAFFSRVDHPVVEHERGYGQVIAGVTLSRFQEYRLAGLNATLEEIIATGKKYLENKKSSRVVFGKDVPTGFNSQSVELKSS